MIIDALKAAFGKHFVKISWALLGGFLVWALVTLDKDKNKALAEVRSDAAKALADFRVESATGIATIRQEIAGLRELFADYRAKYESRLKVIEDTMVTLEVMDIRDQMVAERNTNNWIPDLYSIKRDVIAGRTPVPRRRVP